MKQDFNFFHTVAKVAFVESCKVYGAALGILIWRELIYTEPNLKVSE